jgi:hypothetical protein
MQKIHDPGFIVVIRSACERTVSACKHIVLQEVPEKFVHVIECRPFEAALRECYKIGIKSGKKWMVTIDGDVLPKPGFANGIVKLTNDVSDKVIMFNAIIHDKLMMSYRTGGVKIYRVKYLKEALEEVPDDGKSLRPEAATLQKMMKRGLKKKNFNFVIGLHDYEQYYRDIYRTAYFHATKHKEKVANLLPRWKNASKTDSDYAVAVKGAVDGLLSEHETKSDVRYFSGISKKAVESLGLNEKDSININRISQKVEDELTSAGPFYRMYELNGIKKELKKRGLLRGGVYLTGMTMEIAGKKIISWAQS